MRRDRRNFLATGLAVLARPRLLAGPVVKQAPRFVLLSGESMPLRLAVPDRRFFVVETISRTAP